jgi:serine protease
MSKKFRQFVYTLLLCSVMPQTYAVLPASGYVTQEARAAGVIVKMRNDPTPPAVARAGGQPRLTSQTVAEMKVVAAADLIFKRTASLGTQVLDFSQPMNVPEAQAIAERLMTMPDVEYATPNLILKPMRDPNDPLYVSNGQWALNGVIAGANLPAAWDVTTGGTSSVTIAILDTGYTTHTDLPSTNFTTDGYDFISNPTTAGDGDGRDPDARDEGDFCTTDGSDSSWHGTAVMSIIGAITNNNALMAGVNWNAKMIPVRVLGRCGGTLDDIIDAIRWAVGLPVSGVPANTNPAKVINMSLGGIGYCDALTQSAIDDAHATGAVIVVAAGNDAIPASYATPANCNHVMAIASHDVNGDISYFSNFGNTIALSAPGQGITIATCASLTTYVAGSIDCGSSAAVAIESGTSFSAPMVSGVASLIFAVDSSFNNVYAEQVLRNTARPFYSGSSCSGICGGGMLDAAAALAMVTNFVTPAAQIELSKDGGGDVSLAFWFALGLLVWAYRRFKFVGFRAVRKD